MTLDRRSAVIARRGGSAVLVAVTAAAAVGLSRGLPDPELMATLDNTCLQFSQDGGTVWGGVGGVSLRDTFTPVPGGEYLQADFLARNICDSVATLRVYAGKWNISGSGSATWRTDLAGTPGDEVALSGPSEQADWGVLLGETEAARDQVVPVRLYVGIPDAETAQGYTIDTGWAFALEHEQQVGIPAAPSMVEVRPHTPTTDDRVTVSGTAEPGSTVEVKADGEVVCTTTAGADGTFSCEFGPLPAGEHTITATATNSAGTSEPSTVVEVTVMPADGPDGWIDWGSLGGFLGLGSLVGLLGGIATGSLGAPWTGSLGLLGDAGSAGSFGSLGSAGRDDADGTPGTGGTPGGGSGPGAAGGSQAGAQSSGGSSGSAAGSHWGGRPGAASGGASGVVPGASVGAGSAGSGTGYVPGESLGYAPGGPSGTAGGIVVVPGNGAPGQGAQGQGAPGAAAPGNGAPGQGSPGQGSPIAPGTGAVPSGSLGSEGSAGSSGSAGSAGSLGSVDGLVLLGGPTIRVEPR